MVNRLAKEKSPYLLQHAQNPVDWYPWGEEAFQEARKRDKPIFLSIGYATCHWCHVMERESFSNIEIGKLMNEIFVNIKVDREEHPEVDSIYIDLAQALIPSAGGWPLNMILTPDLKPFFAITYLPPSALRGMEGLLQLLPRIQELWNSPDRKQLIQQAEQLVELFAHTRNATGDLLPSKEDLAVAVERFFDSADPIHGGLKGELKFPMGYSLEWLLGVAKREKESRALFYVELTLEKMASGGLYDHLGGGFSRYAIDREWNIPHFEKMLYDNAILAKSYLTGWRYTKREFYADIAKETLGYLLGKMRSPEGGFFSGEDSDLEGDEGGYYLWSFEEINSLLPRDIGELFLTFYRVTERGNFRGKNVLSHDCPLEQLTPDLRAQLGKGKKLLLEKREERPPPFIDDKILTSWNGLAIDACAWAGVAFQEPHFQDAAIRAATFLKMKLSQDGRILHRFRDQEAKFSGGLDDYAFLIKGLLTLFETGQGTSYLNWALSLTKVLERDFKEMEGAFYQTDGKEPLIFRKCEFYDGAEPSGNGVHTENLLRLYQITQEERYLIQAEEVLKAAKGFIEGLPMGGCYHLMNLQRYLDLHAPTLIIALDEQESLKQEIAQAIFSSFLPHATTLWKRMGDPFAQEYLPLQGKTTLYICRQAQCCGAPLIHLEEILAALKEL